MNEGHPRLELASGRISRVAHQSSHSRNGVEPNGGISSSSTTIWALNNLLTLFPFGLSASSAVQDTLALALAAEQ